MSQGKRVMRGVKADAYEGYIEVLIQIKDGHGLEQKEACDLAEYLASETMKMIAAAPGLSCPLSKIKVSGR